MRTNTYRLGLVTLVMVSAVIATAKGAITDIMVLFPSPPYVVGYDINVIIWDFSTIVNWYKMETRCTAGGPDGGPGPWSPPQQQYANPYFAVDAMRVGEVEAKFIAEDVDEIGEMQYVTSQSTMSKTYTIVGPNNDVLPPGLNATSTGGEYTVSFPVKHDNTLIGPNTHCEAEEHIWTYAYNSLGIGYWHNEGWHPTEVGRFYYDGTGHIVDVKQFDTTDTDFLNAAPGQLVRRIRQQNRVTFAGCDGTSMTFLLSLHYFYYYKVDDETWRIVEVDEYGQPR